MIRRVIRISNELGLHARAAAQLVKTTSRFESRVTLTTLDNRKKADGKSILGVMLLAASRGTELELTVEGADEEAATSEIMKLIEGSFNEAQ
jgi:phosphocarrier protein HPr